MTYLAPATVTITVDQLRSLIEDASALSIRATSLLEACGIDATRPIPIAIPTDDTNVVVLADYRSRRAVS